MTRSMTRDQAAAAVLAATTDDTIVAVVVVTVDGTTTVSTVDPDHMVVRELADHLGSRERAGTDQGVGFLLGLMREIKSQQGGLL